MPRSARPHRPADRTQRGARNTEKVDLAEEHQKIVRSAVVMANELKAKVP
jgi:hypothetical protein